MEIRPIFRISEQNRHNFWPETARQAIFQDFEASRRSLVDHTFCPVIADIFSINPTRRSRAERQRSPDGALCATYGATPCWGFCFVVRSRTASIKAL